MYIYFASYVIIDSSLNYKVAYWLQIVCATESEQSYDIMQTRVVTEPDKFHHS